MVDDLSPEARRFAAYVEQEEANGKSAGKVIYGLAELTGLGKRAMTDPGFMATLQEVIDSDRWPWSTFRPRLSLPTDEPVAPEEGRISEPSDPRENSDDAVKCHFCGGSPVLSRASGQGPGGSGVCRDCLVKLTASFNSMVLESSDGIGVIPDEDPGSAESISDEEVLFKGFDTAFSRMGLVQSISRLAESGRQSISMGWNGDSAVGPDTRIVEDLDQVRALLLRHGYREVHVVMGIDTELVANGKLGRFYERPDPNNPRWTAQIEFERDEGPPSSPG